MFGINQLELSNVQNKLNHDQTQPLDNNEVDDNAIVGEVALV